MRRILTEHVHPPTPIRCCDWIATLDNYDGAEDSRSPIGTGSTEAEAVADLQAQLAERAEQLDPEWHAEHADRMAARDYPQDEP